MIEEWKTIPSYETYEISSLGRFRRKGVSGRYKDGQLVNGSISKTGYRHTHIYNTDGRRSVTMHRLVAECFVSGWSQDRNEVNHIDGDKSNNTPANLEWVSRQQNVNHSDEVLTGRGHMTRAMAERIRRDRAETGATYVSLARKYRTTDKNIYAIVNYKSWKVASSIDRPNTNSTTNVGIARE